MGLEPKFLSFVFAKSAVRGDFLFPRLSEHREGSEHQELSISTWALLLSSWAVTK